MTLLSLPHGDQDFHRLIQLERTHHDDTIQDCDADQHVFEQEKQISTVIEPSRMEMKQVISYIKPLLVRDHGDESHDGDPMERWYAQTSINIDGIYYYQP